MVAAAPAEAATSCHESTANKSLRVKLKSEVKQEKLNLLAEQAQEQATLSKDQYYLTVAQAYGDSARIAELVPEIARDQKALTFTNSQLASVASDAKRLSVCKVAELTRVKKDITIRKDEVLEAALKDDLANAEADLAVQQYDLSVATQYGDTLRAGIARANIATDKAEISSDTTRLKKLAAEIAQLKR
jgi:hypothetical protein